MKRRIKSLNAQLKASMERANARVKLLMIGVDLFDGVCLLGCMILIALILWSAA